MATSNERTFPCTVCQTEVRADLPPGEIINKPTFSMLVMPHQSVALCPNCGQAFTFILRGIKGMEFGWMAVSIQKEESNIIETPSLLDISSFSKKH